MTTSTSRPAKSELTAKQRDRYLNPRSVFARNKRATHRTLVAFERYGLGIASINVDKKIKVVCVHLTCSITVWFEDNGPRRMGTITDLNGTPKLSDFGLVAMITFCSEYAIPRHIRKEMLDLAAAE
jgi:hypothetical protein